MNNPYTYSVSDFVNNIKITLTESFPSVAVLGEVSQINYHEKSGHLYFNIKDDKNSINCVIWKNNVQSFLSIIKEGEVIKIIGKITIFPNSSKFYLNGIYLTKHSQGNISQNLVELKNKLSKAGLFDAIHKKHITRFPSKIGLITSKDGAVIDDIKTTLADAYPTKIQLINCNMQGQSSVSDIIIAIDSFNNAPEKPDFILIARGGGSKEDLLHFNDEDLVKAIFNSKLPIMTAIGHDNDISLADLVADISRPTPTAAATWIAKKIDIFSNIKHNRVLLQHNIAMGINFNLNLLNGAEKALLKPKQIMEELRYRLQQMHHMLLQYHKKINMLSLNLANVEGGLHVYRNNLYSLKSKVINQSILLEELSFKKTLQRGFAMIYDKQDQIIKDIDQLQSGSYTIELSNGKKHIKITSD